MTTATAFTLNEEMRTGRFSDLAVSPPVRKEQKPGKDDGLGHTCPYCEQKVPPARRTFYWQFGGGCMSGIAWLWPIAETSIVFFADCVVRCVSWECLVMES